MTRHEDEDDEDFDPEGPDPSEMDASDEPDLAVCPNCRRMISEETQRCPHCGEYITPSQAPMSPVTWIVMLIIVAALILIFVVRY